MKAIRDVRERVGWALASGLLLLVAGCGFGEPYEISADSPYVGPPTVSTPQAQEGLSEREQVRARVRQYAQGCSRRDPETRDQIVEASPEVEELANLAAQAHRQGRYPAAARHYEELLSRYRAPIVLYNMAVSYEHAGELTGARCTYFELLEASTTPRMCQRTVSRLERLVELDPRPGAGCQEYGARAPPIIE